MKRNRANSERGSSLVIALMVMVLLSLLGAAMLSMSEVETLIASNDQWAEGAFYAAEAAAQVALDAIGESPSDSVQPVALTDLGDGLSYRSGTRTDNTAQPLQLVGSFPLTGYTVGATSGYGSTGFVVDVYQVNATGLGPRNAAREVEVQAEFGPRMQ